MEERIARIEEIVKRTDRSMQAIEKTVPYLYTEVALLKRDAKWHHTIVVGIAAVAGSVAGFIAELLRK